MLFWTKAEYLKFAEAMMDKPLSYYAFEVLYWCGVHMGELLALTPADFDFERHLLTINKSYQRVFPTDAQKAAADLLAEDRRGTAGTAGTHRKVPLGWK